MNMVEVIARGAVRRAHDLPCPFCGADPPLGAVEGRQIYAGRRVLSLGHGSGSALGTWVRSTKAWTRRWTASKPT